MSHTDPISDMLTRIRNGILVHKKHVSMPYSKVKFEIAKIFKKEGYITDLKKSDQEFPAQLIVELKYKKEKRNVIEGLEKVSKPGRRVYSDVEGIPKVLGGMGVSIVSTSQGLMTGKECKEKNVGGEILINIW